VTVGAAEHAILRRKQAWLLTLAALAAITLLGLVSFTWIIVLVPVAVAATALLLNRPVLAIFGLIASVPAQQVAQVGPITVTRIFVILAIVATILVPCIRRRSIETTWLALPFALFVIWMAVSAEAAVDSGLAQAEIMRWVVAFASFVVMLQFLVGASRRTAAAVVLTIGVVAALQAAIGVIQGLLALGPPSFQVVGSLSRAYGTFGRPNTFAGYLEMTLFPVLWVAAYFAFEAWRALRKYREVRLRGFAASTGARSAFVRSGLLALALNTCTVAILGGIGFSFSRGAWLGVIAGLVISGALAFRRYLIPIAAVAPVLAVGFLLLGTSAPTALTGRLGSIVEEARPFDASNIPVTHENFATAERMAHWQAGWNMFLDHPITGIGPGNYNARYPEYFVRAEFRFSQGHAHNYYIHALAETGLVGLLLYLTLMFSALGVALRVALRGVGFARALALGAVGTTSAVMMHNVFENLHVLNLGIQLGATWVLALTALRMHTRASETAMRYMEYSRA
jgi:O-antigen ligase